MSDRRVYAALKTAWLLAQGAVLPLAVLYLCSRRQPLLPPGSVHQFLLMAAGVVFLVVWLIMESLLAMHNFPLGLWAALQLTLGYYLQNAIIVLGGASLLFSSFASLYVSLAAVSLFLCLILGQGFFRGRAPGGEKAAILPALAVLCGVFYLIILWPALAEGFSGLSPAIKIMDGLALAANGIFYVRTLYRTSIFSQEGRPPASVEREWGKWAGRTIGVFILSTVMAAVLGGIFGFRK